MSLASSTEKGTTLRIDSDYLIVQYMTFGLDGRIFWIGRLLRLMREGGSKDFRNVVEDSDRLTMRLGGRFKQTGQQVSQGKPSI